MSRRTQSQVRGLLDNLDALNKAEMECRIHP
jgi:hypothetical protein